MFKQLVFFELYTKLAYIPKDRALSKQSRSGEIPSPLNKHFPTLIFFFFLTFCWKHPTRTARISSKLPMPLTDRGPSTQKARQAVPGVGLTRGRERFVQRGARRWARSSSQRAASPLARSMTALACEPGQEPHFGSSTWGDHRANTALPHPRFPLARAGWGSLWTQLLLPPPPPLRPHSPLSSGA